MQFGCERRADLAGTGCGECRWPLRAITQAGVRDHRGAELAYALPEYAYRHTEVRSGALRCYLRPHWERGSWTLLLREEAMRIQKLVGLHRVKRVRHAREDQRDFTADQQAILSAAVSDERHNAWALEMLGRRNAVARWRGQPGCSVREVIKALDALPA